MKLCDIEQAEKLRKKLAQIDFLIAEFQKVDTKINMITFNYSYTEKAEVKKSNVVIDGIPQDILIDVLTNQGHLIISELIELGVKL